ncbi:MULTISPECIES: TonB-dependent siderophore receptor [unclassified Variovorax]|jgi:outer-membrane receptor for ferric coprogen and ferric-rhodotorulic acid|uniref:TonB-dependent siderophore receptor n=1 Tax=unclassified Variovorax TaxID=663243 RepID=UPI000869A69D|nr:MULTISPECIES: TonB-dependent siderophore receptor [unclassified Variovorax]MBN8756565.1 TonB-dependent siderophore receptor [Variovorax sp.]ODU18962.1 MAG: TonB-dependent receptor [Variovorax sp. SCN 67-85]ODV23625.1 MAG: TonB-dependent receptor [Variovorax sp. SCN 67-20]OJZ08227.1 MAG: TonB-dependent receptor [Variovorax sp. 67-131]
MRQSRPVPARFSKLAPLALAAALAAGLCGPAQAQASAAFHTSRDLAIGAQAMGPALNELARQAGLQLMFPPALVAGKTAPAVSGRLTPRQAVDRLLAGSGLAAELNGDAVVVKPAPPAAAGDHSTLPAVTVSAEGPSDGITESTGSYTTRATGAGTRMALSLRETPQSVSVVGRQQIEDQNLTTLVDVLRQTPGIVADRLDERVSFSSRGFALGTMIDGVPTLSYNTVAGESSMASTSIYDRVEVIRGAAGLLNGAGSPGGSVNLVRKRPTAEFSGHVTAGFGSWNRYTSEVDVGGSLNAAGTVRGRVVASHTAGDSFIENKKQREDVFYGIAEMDVAPGTLLTAGYEYQKTGIDGANFGQAPLFYRNGLATQLPRSYNSSTPWSTWDMTTQRLFVNLDHRFGNGWRLKADAAYAKNDRERFSGDLWLYPANISPSANLGLVQLANNPANSTNKSLDVYATGPFDLFGRTHEASVGFNINRYDYGYGNWGAVPNAFDRRTVSIFSLGSIAQPAFNYPLNHFDGTTEEKGLYAAARFKPLDALSVLVGGRVSWYENQSSQRLWTNGTRGALVTNKPVKEDAVFTPYVGVVYDLSKEYSLYASYTDIFQPNTVRDASNQVLDPKRGTNSELGIKGEHWGGRLNTSFAVFRTQEDNLAVLDSGAPLLADGTAPYRAVKGARSKGFEFTVSGELARGWQVMGGYTYHAKRDNKDVLLNPTYPRRLFRVATSYRFPGDWSALTIGGSVSYQSDIYYDESYGTGRATQGGLTLISLMARYEFSKQLSATLNIENLSDKRYYTGLGGYNGYTYGAPRNAWLKATYKF